MRRIFKVAGLLSLVIACTQLVDEEKIGQNAYSGDDGCIYCHTNQERLKTLAPDKGDEGGGSGGG